MYDTGDVTGPNHGKCIEANRLRRQDQACTRARAARVLFYLLIGVLVFALPAFSEVYSGQVTQITAAILFVIGPLAVVVGAFPVLQTADQGNQEHPHARAHARGRARSREGGARHDEHWTIGEIRAPSTLCRPVPAPPAKGGLVRGEKRVEITLGYHPLVEEEDDQRLVSRFAGRVISKRSGGCPLRSSRGSHP